MLFFLILKIICILKNIQQQSNRIYSRTLYPASSNRDDIAAIKLRRIAFVGKRNHKPRGGDCRYSISNSPPRPSQIHSQQKAICQRVFTTQLRIMIPHVYQEQVKSHVRNTKLHMCVRKPKRNPLCWESCGAGSIDMA